MNPSDLTDSFGQCLVRLEDRALRQGLPEPIVREVLGTLQFQPRVIELDRSQPEFMQSFADYLRARVTEQRVARGRELLSRHRDLLTRLTREYGVPGHYLVAFWGLETNFGSFLGSMPTLDSLATLACDGRRGAFFEDELMTALRVLERDSLVPASMRGSWAGAMGHTQFMPSSYLRYAVDGDDDGRIDLWGSEADALASGANYLQSLGWLRGQRWGREVRLPADFNHADAGVESSRMLEQWQKLGVTAGGGQPLPVADFEATLLLPMGHRGPGFLVYSNFEVIMRWNRSQSYAIAVGHLADRIAGGPALVAALPEQDRALSRAGIQAMQQRLHELGLEPGEADGIVGPATRAALRRFQRERDLVADGYPDPATLEAVMTQAPEASGEPE
ncbi:MAG: lytic murein transglycosylase [Xanthomonadaceae bacterium]|nr:lytic murein transglycosylase [Xanthomonadaceae bacterium]